MGRKNVGYAACLCSVLVLGTVSSAGAGDLTVEELAQYRDLDAYPLHQLTNVDLSVYLSLRNRLFSDDPKRSALAEEIGFFALKGLGQPHLLNAPRFDNSQGACVSFVERAIALALASDWNSYYLIRERLRYKGDSFNFFDRNFFTLSEWLPNNTAWLLEDITTKLGPTGTFTSVSRPKAFLRGLKFHPEETDKLAEQQVRVATVPVSTKTVVSYIRKENVAEIAALLRTGDIVLIIRRFEKPGLAPWFDCDHMGIIVCKADRSVTIVHSAPPRGRQQPLLEFIDRHTRIDGLKFLRLRDNARAATVAEIRRLEDAGPTIPVAADEDQAVSLLRSKRSEIKE